MRPARTAAAVPPAIRAIGYVRVSTERQAGEGVSLEAQAAKIRAMADVQDAMLTRIIEDAGESGKSLQRPGLAELLAAVDARAVEVVIVAKLDRLTRSVRDLADLLERFARRNVTLVSVAESLDTGSAAGRLVLNVMASVSQWEREAIGERTREALRHKKSLGQRVGTVPFGFAVSPDCATLVPHLGEQRVLRMIRELRCAGYTLQAIADALNAQGLATRRGSRWQLRMVHHLLSEAA